MTLGGATVNDLFSHRSLSTCTADDSPSTCMKYPEPRLKINTLGFTRAFAETFAPICSQIWPFVSFTMVSPCQPSQSPSTRDSITVPASPPEVPPEIFSTFRRFPSTISKFRCGHIVTCGLYSYRYSYSYFTCQILPSASTKISSLFPMNGVGFIICDS
jgi:hypothetical protein